MASYTLAQIRDRCKQESDSVQQSFVSDAEWLNYINASYTELYGILIQAFGNDYYVQAPSTGYTFVTNGTSNFFALPTDFFKLLGVDIQVSSPAQWVALRPFAFADRNSLSVFNSPIPMAGQTVRVFYIPQLAPLVNDADVVVGVNGWEEFIIIDAAMKALAKEEDDVGVLMSRKQSIVARINSEAENRDAGSPATVVDVLGRRSRGMQYRLNGNSLWLIGNSTPGWLYEGDWGGNGGGWGGW